MSRSIWLPDQQDLDEVLVQRYMDGDGPGGSRRGRRVEPELIEACRRLRDLGMNIAEVAERTHRTYQATKQILRTHGGDSGSSHSQLTRRRRNWTGREAVRGVLVEMGRAHEHVVALHEAGMTLRSIADAADLSESCIRTVYRPRRTPTKYGRYVTKETETRLLAVTAKPDRVPIAAARSAYQRLTAAGWSRAAIARVIDTHPDHLARVLRGPTIDANLGARLQRLSADQSG